MKRVERTAASQSDVGPVRERQELFDTGHWLAFGVVGSATGAMSVYIGFGWLFAVVIVVAAMFNTPRLPALGGALSGIGVGAAALLWFGSQCPANTVCEAAFPIGAYAALTAVVFTLGLAVTLYAGITGTERGGN